MEDALSMQTEDPIGVTLASIGSGASTGGIIVTLTTLVVRILQAGQPDETNLALAVILTVGTMGGLITAVAVAFRASQPIQNLWRRSVAGAIALFGTAIVAIIAMPVELFTGVWGVGGLILLLTLGLLKCRRFLQRPVSES